MTYVLEGGFKHQDSAGNEGVLSDGWCQWMTAGSGVVHSEMPTDELLAKGGNMEGFQVHSSRRRLPLSFVTEWCCVLAVCSLSARTHRTRGHCAAAAVGQPACEGQDGSRSLVHVHAMPSADVSCVDNVGLPQIPPRYQDTSPERIPNVTAQSGNVFVKIIAGESLGVKVGSCLRCFVCDC